MTQIGRTASLRGTRGSRPLVALPLEAAAVTETDQTHRGLVRMALDLHDGPLQDLAALGFSLSRVQQAMAKLPVDTAEAAAELSEVQRQLGVIEATLRAFAARGETQSDTSTVAELIDNEVARFKQSSAAVVRVDVVGEVEPETPSQRIAMQRVLRETLSNVARHSGATEVRISVFESDDVVYLSLTDNGVGFEPADQVGADGRARLGLTGMRRRLELLDGVLTVDSQRGGPTSVTAALKRWRPEA